jgi:glutamine synthetase
LHHSLVDSSGLPVMPRQGAANSQLAAADARRLLSNTGAQWLAGLLAHAPGMAALCAPSIGAYSRYRGSVMAPQAAVWGFDNRGAMLRVLAGDALAGDSNTTPAADPSTRIENRLPEPMANPYLVMAAQVWAGLSGLHQGLQPPPACENAYALDSAAGHTLLPTSLGQALDALAADPVLCQGLGDPMVAVYLAIKRQELARHAQASDSAAWQRREYFGRF